MKLQPIENCARETQRGCKQVCNSAGKMSFKTVKRQFHHNKIKNKMKKHGAVRMTTAKSPPRLSEDIKDSKEIICDKQKHDIIH